MQDWLTRKRIFWLVIGAIVAFLMADAFGASPAHDVRTAGATPLAAALVKSDILFEAVQPNESISDIRCQLWHKLHDTLSCPGDVASTYFPSITQSPTRSMSHGRAASAGPEAGRFSSGRASTSNMCRRAGGW